MKKVLEKKVIEGTYNKPIDNIYWRKTQSMSTEIVNKARITTPCLSVHYSARSIL